MAKTRAALSPKRPSEVLHLRIALRDIEPAIWREIQVASDITFAKLHQILQRVFGWKHPTSTSSRWAARNHDPG